MRKKILITITLVFVFLGIAIGTFFWWASDKYVVPIMMYHSVNYATTPSKNKNIISPENFQRHMAFLKKHGYNVISLKNLVDRIQQKKPFRGKYVVITFDDGYEDNFQNAFPILKSYGYPAIIFTSTQTLGHDGWLKWYQLFEMEKAGIAIGSHTIDQSYLPNLSTQEKRRQIMESKKTLEANLGHSVDFIAYPTGGFDKEVKKIVKEAGYLGACTTNRGKDKFNKDVYELNRIKFSNADNSDIILWVKLSGYYNLFRKLKPSH